MFLSQLVRQLESQGGDIAGEDSATPRKIFQILNQVYELLLFFTYLRYRNMCCYFTEAVASQEFNVILVNCLSL